MGYRTLLQYAIPSGVIPYLYISSLFDKPLAHACEYRERAQSAYYGLGAPVTASQGEPNTRPTKITKMLLLLKALCHSFTALRHRTQVSNPWTS